MRKRKKFIWLAILIVILLVMLITIVSNKMFHTTYETLPDIDKKMLEELSNIYKQFDQSEEPLWNGKYSFQTQPLMLIKTRKDQGILQKTAYVINVPMDRNLFAKEISLPKSLGLPKVYRISLFPPKNLKTWMPNNFGTLQLKGKETMYYKYYPKMMNDPELYFDFSSFLLHESFHIFKQKLWTFDNNDGEWIENYPDEPEQYALMGIEFKLLDLAMNANEPRTIQKYLSDWTVVRSYRYQKWPQLKAETKTEAIEGTARYIEYRYNKKMKRRLTVLAAENKPYHATFMQVFDFISNGQMNPSFIKRSIKYETGAALGLLMDKGNISWKESIEDSPDKPGSTQYEILKNHFQLSNTVSEQEIKNLQQLYDYKNLLVQGEKIATKFFEDK